MLKAKTNDASLVAKNEELSHDFKELSDQDKAEHNKTLNKMRARRNRQRKKNFYQQLEAR